MELRALGPGNIQDTKEWKLAYGVDCRDFAANGIIGPQSKTTINH